jgi:hypothetical protein
MSRRGDITVECDMPTCHAELVIPAERLQVVSLSYVMGHAWWVQQDGQGVRRDICPQCIEEGK